MSDWDMVIAHRKVKGHEVLWIATNRIDCFVNTWKRITIFDCGLIEVSVVYAKPNCTILFRTSTGGEKNSLVEGSTISASSIFWTSLSASFWWCIGKRREECFNGLDPSTRSMWCSTSSVFPGASFSFANKCRYLPTSEWSWLLSDLVSEETSVPSSSKSRVFRSIGFREFVLRVLEQAYGSSSHSDNVEIFVPFLIRSRESVRFTTCTKIFDCGLMIPLANNKPVSFANKVVSERHIAVAFLETAPTRVHAKYATDCRGMLTSDAQWSISGSFTLISCLAI